MSHTGQRDCYKTVGRKLTDEIGAYEELRTLELGVGNMNTIASQRGLYNDWRIVRLSPQSFFQFATQWFSQPMGTRNRFGTFEFHGLTYSRQGHKIGACFYVVIVLLFYLYREGSLIAPQRSLERTKNLPVLTDTEVALLFEIWRLEHKEQTQELATRAKLAKLISGTDDYVSQLLTRIRNKCGKGFVESIPQPGGAGNGFSRKSRTRGRPPATYRLNPSKVVTKEETAILLLAMQKYRVQRSHEINCDDFIKDMCKVHGFEEDFIKGRIGWAMRTEYIYSLNSGTIACDRRLMTEQPFLERLATA